MGRNPFTQNGLLRTLSMSTCVQYAKKSLTNPSKQNAKPPIYLCQLPFICLWDMWIPLPSLQNCNWKSSGVHWTSSFCSTNYTIRTRFSMPYMYTHYKTTPAATASRKLHTKPCDNTHTKWNPSARGSFSYITTSFPSDSFNCFNCLLIITNFTESNIHCPQLAG